MPIRICSNRSRVIDSNGWSSGHPSGRSGMFDLIGGGLGVEVALVLAPDDPDLLTLREANEVGTRAFGDEEHSVGGRVDEAGVSGELADRHPKRGARDGALRLDERVGGPVIQVTEERGGLVF